MLPVIVNSNTPYGILNAQARSHSALEANEPFAAKIGAVIAIFAFIERDMPMIISRLTGMDPGQAFAVAGVFRAFSNRIDMFAELIKLMNDDQVERWCPRWWCSWGRSPRFPASTWAGHVPGTAESTMMGLSLTGAMVSRVM